MRFEKDFENFDNTYLSTFDTIAENELELIYKKIKSLCFKTVKTKTSKELSKVEILK